MRICMVILNTTSLRHDARVRKEANSLVEAGHSVKLVGLRQPGEPALDGIGHFNVTLFKLRSRGLPRSRLTWPVKYAEFLLKALPPLLRFRAHVYHAHDLDALIPAWLAARLTGARVVYDSHELFTERPIELAEVWRAVERFLLTRVEAVIAASGERAEIMHREYGAHELPTVIANCPSRNVHSLSSTVRDRLPLARRDKRIVLYQGGLAPGRCLESLTLAASSFDDSTVLVYVGNPTSFSDSVLRPLVNKRGLRERVFFIPAVDPDDVVPFISTADLGVVIYKNTCRNNYYCAPNKLYDYCMAGLPIVAADLPPLRTLMDQYGLGRLFDPEQPASIAAAVNTLLADHIGREQAVAGSRIVAGAFNWEEEATRLIHVYSQLDIR